MKSKIFARRRVIAVAVCFAIVFGMLANFGLFQAIADAVTKQSFYVNFADLAGEVTDTQYNGGTLYKPVASDAANQWVAQRFGLFYNREGRAYGVRNHLGQSSYDIEVAYNEPYKDGSSQLQYWSVDKDGYLQHTTTYKGGEMLRKGNAIVPKFNTAYARMKNFEATLVFNTEANDLGAVYVSFHEETPGKFLYNGTTEAVIVGNGNGSWAAAGVDGVLVKKSGESINNNRIGDNVLANKLNANTDYVLFVKSQGTTLTVKLSEVGGTTLYEKTTENAVTAREGYISFGTTNTTRSFKSIEVKEFNDSGKQVNFGNTVKDQGPVCFNADFDELNGFLTDADYTNGLHRPGNTTSASDTAINKWIADRFFLRHNRENRGGPRGYIGQSSLEIDNSYSESATNGGDHYFQVDKEGYLQHTATVTWWEILRKGDTLTAKQGGDALQLKNFEASLVFNTEANAKGSVYLLFHEQVPGTFSWAAGANTSIAQDAVIVGTTGSADGLTVKKAGSSCSNNAMATALPTNLQAHTDYELYVKVIGTALTVKISTADGKTVIYEKTTTGEISSAAGGISIGTTNATRSFARFTVKELDEYGKQVDLGTFMGPTVDVDTYKVDFADAAAKVASGSYNAYNLYSSTGTDAVDTWAAERFTMYSSREGHTFSAREYLGQKPLNGENKHWQVHNSGYLRMGGGWGDGMLRTIELLTAKDDGEYLYLKNFDLKVAFKLEDIPSAMWNRAGGLVVTFHDRGDTPGRFDWNSGDATDNPDMFFVGLGMKGYNANHCAGYRIKAAGANLADVYDNPQTSNRYPNNEVAGLQTGVDYELHLKAIGADLSVSITKPDGTVVVAETTYENAISQVGGAISIGLSNGEHWLKGFEITELDDEGNPVNLGTLKDTLTGGGDDEELDENAYVIDFADLTSKVPAASFGSSNLYRPGKDDTVVNDWIANRFALYYNRECRGGVRDYIGQSSADIENAYGENYKDGGNIHYFEISKTGYLQHTCAQNGWEHFRKGDALTLKHNGDIVKLQNFEAELVYNTKANALGSVYISFHEQRPGVIGWTTDAKTSIEQDAVIITNTGITVKKSGDHQGSSGANQFKNTTVETVFDPAVQANTDYKLYIKVIGTDLTVKLTTADGATTVHEKRYTNAVSSAAGAFSIGTTNSTRSFKKLIVTELDDEGASVPMGSAMKPLGVDGFKVDFAELALKVDEAKFDASTGLYTSTVADTAINSWVAERFDLLYSRENRAWSVRDYLGQSSVDIENAYGEPYKDGAGNAHYFQIDKKGYLQHTTTGIGGEMLRKGDALIIKHGGKAATLKNFEATLGFNTKANRLGAVYVSFHEGTAGKFMLGGNSNAVILGNGNGTYQGNGNDGIVVKKNGTAINNNKLADTFTSALEKDTDYQLYVKVVGTTVTVKVLSADGKTAIFEKSYENAIAEGNGFISFGTTNATRSFKSIEITELDEFGDPVPFGTLTENGATPKIFLADFAALAGLVPEKSFNTNGAYTSSAADTAINKWVNNRFLLKYHREGHTFFDRAYLGQNSNSFNNDAGYGGDHHWEIEKGGYLLHSAQLTGGEMFRKGDALVLKSGDAAAYVENFEATVIFNTEENKLGSVYLSFHETSPGTFSWTAGGVAFAAVGNGNGSYAKAGVDGLIVKPLDKTTANNNMENADRFAEALEPNTDYKMYVKVLNNDLYVTVSTMDDKVIVSRECENAITSRGGSIAVGTTNTNRSIRFIKVVQLDQSGTPIDFGSVTKPGIDTENTVLYDFEDAAQLNNFDRYYVPEVKTEDAKAIKITGTANDTFSVDGSLKWARSPLYCTDKELADGVERDGRVWQDTFIPVYRDNVGIAVLNTRTYKNFILDVEFTANSYWPLVGFGAQGNDGEDVFYTQKGGGYTIRLESNSGGKGTMTALSGETFAGIGTSVVDYNGYGGVHSFHIIVSNRKVYVYVDANTTAMEFDLPASYNGGYIYLASNNPGVSYDNLKITDLDAKNIEITDMVTYFDNFVLNRDEGDALNLPNRVTVRDADNHEYDLPVTSWDNDTYRSNKAGNYVFKPNMPSIKGFTYADEWNPDVSVVNNINNDYNTTTSRKYYFDHANDFKDFSAYYAQENYGGVKGKWSTYDGKLVKGEATDLWRAVGGRVTNNYNAPSRGWSGLNMSKSISTLMLNDVNLINYRVEMDYTHGPSCWYTYLICGQQDPTQFYWKESSTSSFDYATEKGLVMDSNHVIHKAGAWCMAEQEGRLNVCSGLREHPKRTYTTEDILPETHYHDTYDRSQTHHMVVTVVDGYLTMQIDHSEPFVWQLHDDVHGGLVGIASMGHGAYVSNFQVTALDYKGNEVPFDQAAEGKSFEDIFVGFDPSNRDWIFDWNKNYLFEF